MIPTTVERVPLHTCEHVNSQIRHETEERLAQDRNATQEELTRRLAELDEEWDIERALEANAATVALTGTLLAATVDRRWVVLPMAVAGFLLQHAVQGWCPPLGVLRRLGFRTQREIDNERTVIKMLRGDFGTSGDGRLRQNHTSELLHFAEM